MSPLIAITGNYADGKCTLLEGYFASVIAAGGSPVIVPPYADETLMESLLDRVDAIIFSGGGDIDPHLLGEEPIPEVGAPNVPRDAQELPLVRMAVRKQMPVLGICRGIQVMTAALGGKLWQDIYVQGGATISHDQGDLPRYLTSHEVEWSLPLTPSQGGGEKTDVHNDGSLRQYVDNRDNTPKSLAIDKLLGYTTGLNTPSLGGGWGEAVNSFHHQAVREPAPGFRVAAKSPDGIIEAVVSTEYKSLVGVQWHPECFILNGDRRMMPLFEWFVGEAASYARARQFHNTHLTLDTHCDTPMFFHEHVDFHTRDPRILVTLPGMTDGRLDATIMVAYIQQDLPGHYDYAASLAKTDSLLDGIEAIAAQDPSRVAIARTPADLWQCKREGRKAIMLGIENGYAIGEDLTQIERFRRRGVVYMTLCHNGNNAICASARPRANEDRFVQRGLTAFGRSVVAEMNRVGMMVDLSHAAEQSFYDALQCSRTPIVCSHSSSRALCDHPRNLTDDQLRALRDVGGVAQVCLYGGFLRPEAEGPATILDAVRHLMHMIEVAGIDHVGIGTDFDGDGGIIGCAHVSEVMNLTRRLQAEGLTDADLQKVWGANFLRVMEQAQAAATL